MFGIEAISTGVVPYGVNLLAFSPFSSCGLIIKLFNVTPLVVTIDSKLKVLVSFLVVLLFIVVVPKAIWLLFVSNSLASIVLVVVLLIE